LGGAGQQNAAWISILEAFKRVLDTLKSSQVPAFLVRKLFQQLFSFLNVQLFNQLLLRRECCSFSNGEFVKTGLGEVEQWIHVADSHWVGESWDQLKNIRQVGILFGAPSRELGLRFCQNLDGGHQPQSPTQIWIVSQEMQLSCFLAAVPSQLSLRHIIAPHDGTNPISFRVLTALIVILASEEEEEEMVTSYQPHQADKMT